MTLKQFLNMFYPGQYFVNIYVDGQETAHGWLNDWVLLIANKHTEIGNLKVKSNTRVEITVGNNGLNLTINLDGMPTVRK